MSDNFFEVIVIGAGPAGVSLAAELIQGGLKREDVLLLEKAEQKSWVMRELYPDQKLVTANYKGMDPVCHGLMRFTDMNKNEALDVLKDTVDKYSVQVNYETFVTKVTKEDELFLVQTTRGEYKSRHCAIGIGVFGKPNKPNYKIPSVVRKLTQFDITSNKITNSNVLVVGGGDSASEYAQFLELADNKVSISSREIDFSYMNEQNRAITHKMISEKKLSSYSGTDIVELSSNDEKVDVLFKDDSFPPKTFDRIVYAIGGTTPLNFLTVTGMEINNKKPVINSEFETTVKDLYLLGDLANGMKGGSIVLAFNTAHTVAQKIKSYSA